MQTLSNLSKDIHAANQKPPFKMKKAFVEPPTKQAPDEFAKDFAKKYPHIEIGKDDDIDMMKLFMKLDEACRKVAEKVLDMAEEAGLNELNDAELDTLCGLIFNVVNAKMLYPRRPVEAEAKLSGFLLSLAFTDSQIHEIKTLLDDRLNNILNFSN